MARETLAGDMARILLLCGEAAKRVSAINVRRLNGIMAYRKYSLKQWRMKRAEASAYLAAWRKLT